MTLAVLCPGQGAQHPAMLDFALTHAEGRRTLDDAHAALGADLRAALRSDRMFDNAVAQPLVCVAQLAQWRALRDALPVPRAFAGYSVGELACYGAADAVDAATLATLARDRALAMDTAAAARPGGLIALRGLPRRDVAALCEGLDAYVAIAVADDAYVVGGTTEAVAAVESRAAARSARITCLRVGVASHTPLLAAAVAPFRAALEASALAAPRIPVIAGVDADTVTTRARALDTLPQQIAQTVEWGKCLDTLHELGCRVMLELGPGRALARMARERFDDIEARAVEEFSSPEAAAQWVGRRTER